MKIQSFRRLIKEDVAEEDRNLIDKIGNSINEFAQEVVDGFNKNITVDENLLQEFIDITVSVNNSGIPTTTSQFKSKLTPQLKGIIVIRVENLTNTNSYPSGAVQVCFTQNSNLITIKHITGLVENNKYRLKLLTIGG